MILLLLLSVNVFAAKLLVQHAGGDQEIIHVSPGTVYKDPDGVVLWDERAHGQMPSGIELGSMRADIVGGKRQLSVDNDVKDAKSAKVSRKSALKNRLRDGSITHNELVELLRIERGM